METDEAPRVLPFQLQFDKPVASQIKIAEWNPEKLLAMVTEDSQILLHRFNWQRPWTISPGALHGLHCLLLDTSIFWKRKYELHQVAQQASNIEDLTEVIHASFSVMCKQWSDTMHAFHEKFDSLSNLIVDHALDSSPQEELLTLLGGAHTSLPVHQFLVNSLSKAGVKCILKVVCGAGKELQHVVLDHLQPAAEMIGFRMGELRGLSRWRARFQVYEGAILCSTKVFQFLYWLLKCIKLLMQEPSDQLLAYNSELVVIFLKFLYDQDPVLSIADSGK
ncbi:hypothetical protein SLE2022_390970 [Rubroshorea leprosula]